MNINGGTSSGQEEGLVRNIIEEMCIKNIDNIIKSIDPNDGEKDSNNDKFEDALLSCIYSTLDFLYNIESYL